MCPCTRRGGYACEASFKDGLCVLTAWRAPTCHGSSRKRRCDRHRPLACPAWGTKQQQQHECRYRQWSDKLIDFPTVSMKSPLRCSPASQKRRTTMRGMLMTCCFDCKVNSAPAQMPLSIQFCHIITRHTMAPFQNSAINIPGITGGILQNAVKNSAAGRTVFN